MNMAVYSKVLTHDVKCVSTEYVQLEVYTLLDQAPPGVYTQYVTVKQILNKAEQDEPQWTIAGLLDCSTCKFHDTVQQHLHVGGVTAKENA